MKREVARGYCTASVHLLTSIRPFAFSEHHQLAVNYWQLMYSDEITILYFFQRSPITIRPNVVVVEKSSHDALLGKCSINSPTGNNS